MLRFRVPSGTEERIAAGIAERRQARCCAYAAAERKDAEAAVALAVAVAGILHLSTL